MHELGIVLHTIDSVEEVAESNHVIKVTKLTLEVGEVSGIVPSYFKDCYEWSKRRTKYMQECELNMIITKAITFCKNCKKTYPTVTYGRICPHCKSEDNYLVTGDEINIVDISVLQDTPQNSENPANPE